MQKLNMRANDTQGKLITFCGLDGCGKTTMLTRLIKELEGRYKLFLTKQPTDFMRGFASTMLAEGYVPAFKANTDAKYSFDREYSRGMQSDRELFEKCLIWAVAPTIAEYDGITTSHLIHPDAWMPYAPSGITRKDIAAWQYGNRCHSIKDDADKETSFNLNLVRDVNMIIKMMF